MSKKGLSDVVTTVIIILLSLVAIGVVWFVVQNIISSGSDSIGIDQFSVDINFLRASINGNDVNLTVKRSAGRGDMGGMKFIVTDGLASEEFTINEALTELQEKTYTVTLISLVPTEVTMASVAPIYVQNNGADLLGEVTDTIIFVGGSGGGGGPGGGGEPGGGAVCGNAVCESGETEASCPADCGSASCVPACEEPTPICNNGLCVPEDCTETRTDSGVCSDAGAFCGNVQDICGDMVDCTAAIGGCTVLEQCVSNQCVPLVAISGTVYTVWPEGVGIYIDSEDLPTDNVYSGYYAKFLSPSQESECLLVADYVLPQPPQERVIIRLEATQTSVAANDAMELWPSFASCSA